MVERCLRSRMADKVQILAPESVKEQYRQMIAQADEGMQQKENKEQEI